MLGEISGNHKTHLSAVKTYVSHVDRTDCRIVLNLPNINHKKQLVVKMAGDRAGSKCLHLSKEENFQTQKPSGNKDKRLPVV